MQKMQNICNVNARIKKFALPMQRNLKRLHCHCKKLQKFAFLLQKMKIDIKIWYF